MVTITLTDGVLCINGILFAYLSTDTDIIELQDDYVFVRRFFNYLLGDAELIRSMTDSVFSRQITL